MLPSTSDPKDRGKEVRPREIYGHPKLWPHWPVWTGAAGLGGFAAEPATAPTPQSDSAARTLAGSVDLVIRSLVAGGPTIL